MGLSSRNKGRAAEQQVVRLARAAGLPARRCWANAQHPDPRERRTDVVIQGLRAQVKVEQHGYKGLYDALDGVELLFVRADRRTWLAVLPAEALLEPLKRVVGR